MPQRIKILIACYRQYAVPDGPCYLPVEVGAALHPQPIPDFTPDNKGDPAGAASGIRVNL